MVIARKYSDEVRAASVQRVLERRHAEPESRSIIREVATDFDVGVQSLRQWVAKVDDGSYDFAPVSDASPKAAERADAEPDSTAEGTTAQGLRAYEPHPSRPGFYEKQIARLREENEALRRALVILAQARSEEP